MTKVNPQMNVTRIARFAALMLNLWPLSVSSIIAGQDEAAGPIAVYTGGTISEQEYQTWRMSQKKPEDADRLVTLQEIALVKHLAAAAIRRGVDQTPEIEVPLLIEMGNLASKALQADIVGSIKITQKELDDAFETVKNRVNKPRKVRLRNLYKKIPSDADEKNRQLILENMQQIRQKIVDGADFAELARSESDSQTRFQGGLIGNVPPGQFGSKLDRIVQVMQPGEISEIIESEDGLTIFFCENIIDPEIRRVADYKKSVKTYLFNRERIRRIDALEESLLRKAQARFHWTVLDHESFESTADDQVITDYEGGQINLATLRVIVNQGRQRELSQLNSRQIQTLIESYLRKAMAISELKARSLPRSVEHQAQLDWLRPIALSRREILRRVTTRFVAAAEQEIKDHFQANQDKFIRYAHYDLSVIVIPIESQERKQIHQQAEDLVKQLRSQARDFATAARGHSTHSSSANGGRLGWTNKKSLFQLGSAIMAAIGDLQNGEITDPIEEKEQLWIFELHDFEDQRRMRYEEAKPQAESQLNTRRLRTIETQITAETVEMLNLTVIGSTGQRP